MFIDFPKYWEIQLRALILYYKEKKMKTFRKLKLLCLERKQTQKTQLEISDQCIIHMYTVVSTSCNSTLKNVFKNSRH